MWQDVAEDLGYRREESDGGGGGGGEEEEEVEKTRCLLVGNSR